MAASRLNLMPALPDQATESTAQTAVKRYLTHVGAAIERMSTWDRSGPATDQTGRPTGDAHS